MNHVLAWKSGNILRTCISQIVTERTMWFTYPSLSLRQPDWDLSSVSLSFNESCTHETSKPLVQVKVVPPGHCGDVTEPHMCDLMALASSNPSLDRYISTVRIKQRAFRSPDYKAPVFHCAGSKIGSLKILSTITSTYRKQNLRSRYPTLEGGTLSQTFVRTPVEPSLSRPRRNDLVLSNPGLL